MRFKPGQVLYGSRRTYLRKVAVADFEGITANTTFVIEPKNPHVLLPELLPFIMQTESFNEHSIKQSKGSVNPYVNFSDLTWYEFRLPPLEEQRQMVEVLGAHRSVRDASRSLTLASKQAHRALRMSIFSGSLREGDVATPSSRYAHVWGATTVREVAEFLDGLRIPLKDSDRAARQGPYPYYGASGVIDRIDDFIFDEELLLVSEDGANLVDRSTPIAFLAAGRYWVNNHAHVLRARSPFSNFLLCEYFESLNLQPYITGTAQPKLNKATCEGIRVPRPPDSELRRIEEALRASLHGVQTCELRSSTADDLLRCAIASMLKAGEETS
jgi:type I restriction enzyme S subunit